MSSHPTVAPAEAQVTVDPCPGVCNREWRKAGGVHQRAIDPVPGKPVWCPGCTKRIRQALHHLVDGYAQLELDKLHGTVAAGEKIGKRPKQAAAPSPSGAADLQDEMVRRLTLWEDQIREARGLATRPARKPVTRSRPLDRCPWPRPLIHRRRPRSIALLRATQESTTLAGTVRFLLSQLDWALAHETAGEDFGRDLLRLRGKVSTRAATAPEKRRRPVPCPRCSLRTLVHVSGSDHVECENPDCGRLLTLDEYDNLAAAVARSESVG